LTGTQIEAADGAIARLRLYDGAATAAEVAGLDTIVVPEPTVFALLALALPAIPIMIRRRRLASTG